MTTREALQRARRALDQVQADPAGAVRSAAQARDLAKRVGDLEAQSIAERAMGLAGLHVQDLRVATTHLRRAVTLGRRAGTPEVVAEARMTLAFALSRQGRHASALDEIGRALEQLGPDGRARALAQRGAILQQLGRLDAASADYRAALAALRRADDLVWVQRVHLNRGVLHAFRYDYVAAERDLREAERLCERLDLRLPAAFVQENLGLVRRRLGDVPAALGHLDAAEQIYESMGAPVGSLLLERGELLLSVHLASEARQAAERAVVEFRRTRRHLSTPEARLLVARAAALGADPDTALREARLAARQFARQGRSQWAALARFAELAARQESSSHPPVPFGRLVRAAAELEAAGWATTALDARLLAGQVGIRGLRGRDGRQEDPRRRAARHQLELVSAARRRGPAVRRVKAWYATALLRQDAGQPAAATRAAAAGLRVLDEHRATMAATDLRARVSADGVELARLGLRNALADGDADRVLAWAEFGRARHLLVRPVRVPADPGLAQRLAELRGVVADIAEDRGSGRPVAALVRRQVGLEQVIRDISRRHRSGPVSGVSPCPSAGQLGHALGDAVLVEYVEFDAVLHAVVVDGGKATRITVGPTQPVWDLVRWLPFALRRLTRPELTRSGHTSAVALLRRVGAGLDALLLGPLAHVVGDRPLVVVPTGVLQSMPWSLLPSVAGRPLTVTPSAAHWSAATARTPRPGEVVVIAGPRLPGAEREARDVAAVYGVPPLTGASATVGRVTAALDVAALVHVAAHGTVRADNPLFSSLTMADGPLTVYDLEPLDRGADTVVLASCESGQNVVLAGDETLGLSAAFLSRETRHVVASVVPVPDAETAPLMLALHRGLADGRPVAAALASACERIDVEDPRAYAAAAGFVCIGAGQCPPAPRASSGPWSREAARRYAAPSRR